MTRSFPKRLKNSSGCPHPTTSRMIKPKTNNQHCQKQTGAAEYKGRSLQWDLILPTSRHLPSEHANISEKQVCLSESTMSVHADETSAGENCSRFGPAWIFLDEGSDGSVQVRAVNEAWMAAHSSSLCLPSFLPHSLHATLVPFLVRVNTLKVFLMFLVYPATLFVPSGSSSLNIDVCETICGLGAACLVFLEIQYRRERLRNSDSPRCVCNTPVHATREHMIGRFNELYVTMPFA